MYYYILDDLKNYAINHLIYKSGNKVVDDFIRYSNNNNIDDILEFVPYDQFKDIIIVKFESFEATWIDGNIRSWNKKMINFNRYPRKIVLKKLNNSENITFKELNEVHTLIIIYCTIP